ncbi:hypothetical protein HAV15_010572 [Penicillium sp. str. |nr:hypothetical protein HAV15_010572 [Penicillium sp. str. \
MVAELKFIAAQQSSRSTQQNQDLHKRVHSLLSSLADPCCGTFLESEPAFQVSKSDRKIEHFIYGITQNGFTDVLSENAALLIETTALKDKIQELEETLDNMQARVDELCKERQVSTIQNTSARKKRAMPQ